VSGPLLAHVDELTVLRVCELAAPITDETSVPFEAMVGQDRHARIVAARHRLYAALWQAGFSIGEIGRVMRRDHTGVIRGLRKTMGPAAYKSEVSRRYPGFGRLRAS
jgi:chromosomal replication initiation ATPase DnaA